MFVPRFEGSASMIPRTTRRTCFAPFQSGTNSSVSSEKSKSPTRLLLLIAEMRGALAYFGQKDVVSSGGAFRRDSDVERPTSSRWSARAPR